MVTIIDLVHLHLHLRSSQGVDPGNIRAIGLSVSKARSPNTSGEMDMSRSITPSEFMFI